MKDDIDLFNHTPNKKKSTGKKVLANFIKLFLFIIMNFKIVLLFSLLLISLIITIYKTLNV